MAEAREFRPIWPRFREVLPVAFLALLLMIVAPGVLMRPGTWSLVMLTGTALLVLGGAWLLLRLRFPGSPLLRVDGEGLSYVRSGHEQRLRWDEVEAIHVDHQRTELIFLPASGKTPIVVHRDMAAADGQRFDMLIEHYWRPPAEAPGRS